MEKIEGEPSRAAGQGCPAAQNLQGKKTGKPPQPNLGVAIHQSRSWRGDGTVPVFSLTPEQLGAIKQFLQVLFKSVTTAILVFLAGGVGTSEILHPFTHTAGGGHKSDPIQNTTRREDRGETGVEIQQVEGEDDGGSATGNGPDSEGTGLVPCEALGVGCLTETM